MSSRQASMKCLRHKATQQKKNYARSCSACTSNMNCDSIHRIILIFNFTNSNTGAFTLPTFPWRFFFVFLFFYVLVKRNVVVTTSFCSSSAGFFFFLFSFSRMKISSWIFPVFDIIIFFAQY